MISDALTGRTMTEVQQPRAVTIAAEDQDRHDEWDDFLTRTTGGDLTQSSGWARLKRSSGMDTHRVVLRLDGAVAGGVQLFARRFAPLGAVAYVPYGPVTRAGLPDDAATQLVRYLQWECHRRRIRALFVQPPDHGGSEAVLLRAAGFRPSEVDVAPSASLRLDLRMTTDELVSHMSRHKRADMRRSQREALSVRVATRGDLRSFHELHCSSATRKGFEPAPLDYLEAMWDELHPAGQLAIFLVSSEGTDLAGLLVTRLAGVATDRLRGFAADRLPRRMRPNDALTLAAVDWARERGSRWYDLGGIPRPDAIALAAGTRQSDPQLLDSSAAHKFELGGEPVIYPSGLELVPNPVARLGFRMLRATGTIRRVGSLVRARGRAATPANGSSR